MTKAETEKLCLDYADLAGRLSAVVEWFLAHDGACLRDNPAAMVLAREALAESIAFRGDDSPSDVDLFVAERRESIGRGARRALTRFKL